MGKNCSYSECICDIPQLNHKPVYKVGQVWKEYGSFRDSFWEIVYVDSDGYIVGKDGETKKVYAFRIGSHGYANCGTPELRTLVKDVI